jgi:hypothetical protein
MNLYEMLQDLRIEIMRNVQISRYCHVKPVENGTYLMINLGVIADLQYQYSIINSWVTRPK